MSASTVDAASREAARRARDDIGFFAEVLAGERLWPHQLQVARSAARIRAMCTGRQAGKSRTLAMLALHDAFRAPRRRVLVLSAGEDAAKDLLSEIAGLAGARLLAGSLLDENQSQVVLSNGSWIRSVPASTKQVRGKSVDLLILDEAAFIDDELWSAAKFTVLARPGSRVVMASTPWGRRDRFFATHWRLGRGGLVDVAGVSVESFHWPSTVSPMVDDDLVEFWRETDPPRVFAREVLAEWVDEAGAYFSSEELVAAVADYQLIEPGSAAGQMAAGGVDWGLARDANTLVLVGALADGDLNDEVHPSDLVFFVPWLEEHFGMRYGQFIDRVAEVADPSAGGFRMPALASETNGVGAMPTESLRSKLLERGTGAWVWPVHTDARRKESAFGAIKMLLQQGRLVLPRHPTLLAQLEALEFETLESGTVRISVPERAGHDDLAMGLAQAMSCVSLSWPPRGSDAWVQQGAGEVLTCGSGTRIHERPRCRDVQAVFRAPRGEEGGDGW